MTTAFALRSPVESDIPALNELIAASERALYGRRFGTGADVTGMLARPRFEPEHDAWVAFEPGGAVAGYAEVWDRTPGRLIEATGVVHPAWVGRGLGSMFIDVTEARAAKKESSTAATLRNIVPSPDAAAGKLLAAAGYRRTRGFQHMAIDLGTAPRPDAHSVAVRAFDRDHDAEVVHAILQTAFIGTFEFEPTPFERWRATWIEAPTFDPSLWFVAETDGEPVGAVLAMTRPQGGWIIDIGVEPKHRGRGIGAALMRSVFEAFRVVGTNLVELNVDAENPTRAVAMYERLGMTVTRAWDLYDKTIGSRAS